VNKKYIVDLTTEKRGELKNRLRGGQMVVRNVTSIQILLKTDKDWSDDCIAEALNEGLPKRPRCKTGQGMVSRREQAAQKRIAEI